LLDAIGSLNLMPRRSPVAEESAELGVELREHFFRSHRIVYWIGEESKVVEVLRVFHLSRVPLTADDIDFE